jgi:hypothetical protein
MKILDIFKRIPGAASDPVTVTLGPQERNDILHYASLLLDSGDREPGQVIATAGPLLEWAAEATDRFDLAARMEALNRTHWNEGARGSARRLAGEAPGRISPHCFLESARGYYAFITDAPTGTGENDQ